MTDLNTKRLTVLALHAICLREATDRPTDGTFMNVYSRDHIDRVT